jgi:hypothetical protein
MLSEKGVITSVNLTGVGGQREKTAKNGDRFVTQKGLSFVKEMDIVKRWN